MGCKTSEETNQCLLLAFEEKLLLEWLCYLVVPSPGNMYSTFQRHLALNWATSWDQVSHPDVGSLPPGKTWTLHWKTAEARGSWSSRPEDVGGEAGNPCHPWHRPQWSPPHHQEGRGCRRRDPERPCCWSGTNTMQLNLPYLMVCGSLRS